MNTLVSLVLVAAVCLIILAASYIEARWKKRFKIYPWMVTDRQVHMDNFVVSLLLIAMGIAIHLRVALDNIQFDERISIGSIVFGTVSAVICLAIWFYCKVSDLVRNRVMLPPKKWRYRRQVRHPFT